MQELQHLRTRLSDVGKAPTRIMLCIQEDGLFFVSVEWPGSTVDCRRASTSREAVQIAGDDLLAPFYNRPYRG